MQWLNYWQNLEALDKIPALCSRQNKINKIKGLCTKKGRKEIRNNKKCVIFFFQPQKRMLYSFLSLFLLCYDLYQSKSLPGVPWDRPEPPTIWRIWIIPEGQIGFWDPWNLISGHLLLHPTTTARSLYHTPLPLCNKNDVYFYDSWLRAPCFLITWFISLDCPLVNVNRLGY